MRWIAVLLVVINVAYFAWGTYYESRREYRYANQPNTVKGVYGARLEFVSEANGEAEVQNSDNRSHAGQSELGDYCFLLGPFDSPDDLGRLKQYFYSLGVLSRERYLGLSAQQAYWAYLQPRRSRDEAVYLLKELQKQGVDSYLIARGELENGVSLGVFGRRSDAESITRRLSVAGYDAAIKALREGSESWWLEINVDDVGVLDNNAWEEVVQGRGKIKKIEKSCKSIAPEDSFH